MDELQHKLIEWVEHLGDIASEQLPGFAAEIIAYMSWDAYIGIVMGALFFVPLFLIFIALLLACAFGKEREDFAGVCFIFLLLTLIPTLFISSNYCRLKKCEVAPKMVIVDYIRGK